MSRPAWRTTRCARCSRTPTAACGSGTADGLDLFDPAHGTFTHYRADPKDGASLADGHVLCLAQDRGGVLLGRDPARRRAQVEPAELAARPRGRGSRGTRRPSAARTSPRSRRTAPAGSGSARSRAVVAVMERASGEMTTYRHDPKNPRSLGSDRVMALRHDQRGRLWIATFDAGVDRFDAASGVFHHYRNDPKRADSLSADGVTTIGEDGAGRLWLGTYGSGLDSFDPETRALRPLPQRPEGRLQPAGRPGLVPQRGGRREAVGRHDGEGTGAPRPAHGPLHPLPARAGRSREPARRTPCTRCSRTRPAGSGWARTAGSATSIPRRGSSRTYTTRDGLANDVVYGVRSDRQGRLWLSTNNGLSCFDPVNGQFRNYGVERRDAGDGVQLRRLVPEPERRAVLRGRERLQRVLPGSAAQRDDVTSRGADRDHGRAPADRRSGRPGPRRASRASATRSSSSTSRPSTSPPRAATASATSSRASTPSGSR